MNSLNPEYRPDPKPHENEDLAFVDKFRALLLGVEFEESVEMFEARTAVLEALAKNDQNPELLRSVWVEYANVCEQTVDSKTGTDPQLRAQLQIAAIVHKALIFREVGDLQRYCEDLGDAEEYALGMHFNEIAEAIGVELDKLAD